MVRKHSEETKRKISLGCKGHYVSPATRQRMAELNKNKFSQNHPCYVENKKHKFYKLIRETYKYRQWRSDIFTRDNFTCIFCGIRGTELNADHFPKSFIDIVREYLIKTLTEALECEELWNINNGRTLCVECHRKTYTWGRLGEKRQREKSEESSPR